MTTAQTAARQQRVEELCAAAIRALAGDAELHFRGRRLHRGARALPLNVSHLHPSLEHDDFGSFRGAADGMALRLVHCDAALHRSLLPEAPAERMLFELFEQFRVEALAELPGVVHNLRHRHEQWSLAFHRSGLTDTVTGLLLYTVAQIARSRVTAQPVVESTEDLIEATRAAIVPALGADLAGLRRERRDQRAYAAHALSLARGVAALVESARAHSGAEAQDDVDDESDARRLAFVLWIEGGDDDAADVPLAASGRSAVLEAADAGYRAFTTAYDQELRAAALVRPELLKELRERLDARIAAQGLNLPRLARELKALLAEPARDGWDGAQEEGQIDGRRLAQLVASPTERRLFRSERVQPVADCLLTFLIDCSGSMKTHVESVAMIVDVFVRAGEQAGVASEVLGFTTGAWNGGRARRDWLRAGRPPHPGRLNERCHLVFKDADTPWRHARRDIAALLKADLFREGIDGEAVEWACDRMEARAEARRLLVVVSDGCPMDSATQLANDAHYLEQHLREVVARREQTGSVEIRGAGVGLDLSPYYRRAQAIDLASTVRNEVFRELLDLIGGRRRR